MRTKREIPFLEEPKIRHIVQNRVCSLRRMFLFKLFIHVGLMMTPTYIIEYKI